MKLSIVIPVYCVPDTLDKCVKSILGQSYEDIEIILVDDGSPDDCPKLCNRLAEIDKRITVVHKVNGGLSDARNAGIRIATGDYITFVDSDDYIDNGVYGKLMNKLTEHPEYDIIEYGIRFKRKDEEKCLSFNDTSYTDSSRYWTEGFAYNHSYACNKIYKRTLFENIHYPQGKVFEDMWTLPLLTKKAKIIATTDIGYYNYCWNPNSITSNAGGNELRMLLMAHYNLMHHHYPEIKGDAKYIMHVVNIQMDVYEMTGDSPIFKSIPITKYDNLSHKNRLKARLLNILGITNLCKINKFFHRFAKCH